MKRMYKRLAVTFLFSAVLYVLIFGVSLYARGKAENGRYLDQLMISVEINLEHASEDYKEQMEFQKTECIRRARAACYIAENDARMMERESLEILKELMNVKDISLIDPSGTIFLSTSRSLEGSREDPDMMRKLEQEAQTEDAEMIPAAVRMDQPDMRKAPGYLYAAAGSGSDRFAAVRVDADLSLSGLTSGKELVGTILKQATTEYGTGIFAAGKESGRIFGITENNSQSIRVENAEEGEELLGYLEKLPKEKPLVLYINGAFQSAVVRDMEGMYLVAFSGLDRVVGDVILTFWLGLAVIGAISILTVLMVRYYLKKYLSSHFEEIREGIYGIIRGERDPREEDSEIPELKPLAEMISRLEWEYVEKMHGMDRMETQLTKARTEAEYDRLTGLYNRAGFEHRTESYLRNGVRTGGALLLMDLDNFKKVNDCEGHPEGDRVLRIFARCLCKVFRKEDVIGRIGGDEFAVLLCNNVPREILEEKSASLREEIRCALETYYEKYHVSASIGAVPVDSRDTEYRKLYRCADTALYIAKYRGKDQFYYNEKMIDCMRRECIGCRADCPRSRIINSGKRAD